MANNPKLQNFVFRGLLLESTFETLKDLGLGPVQPPTSPSQETNSTTLDDFSLNIRLSAIKMSEAYKAFFCFENAVRELVAQRLKEKHKSNWWAKVPKKVRTKVENRKTEERKNKWHVQRGGDELSYSDFGDLSDIIVANWQDFDDLFPDQDWVKTRIGDLEKSRNVIAHNNDLTERETQRIRLYLKDWVLQVG